MSETPSETPEQEPDTQTPETPETPESEQEETGLGDDEATGAEEADADENGAQAVAPPAATAADGMSQEQGQKIANERSKAWERFKQATIEKWLEEGAHLRDCPLCFDSHKGLVDVRDAGMYPKEITDSVMAFLGLAREQDYKQSSSHTPCSFCDANGKVATGSHVPEFTTVTCPECKGYGYTPPPSSGATVTPIGAAPSAPQIGVPDDIQTGEVDNWGELRILPDGRPNPNFGKQPSFKVLVEPYGVTASLTATASESV